MKLTEDLVEGWTAPLDYQLTTKDPVTGVETPFDLSGLSVPVTEAHDSTGTVIALSGTTTVVDEAQGKVRFTPAAGDLTKAKSPYFVRFKVTDAGGKDAFFPSGFAIEWVVRK